MRPEARTIGQALLDHHRATTQAHPPSQRILIKRYTITYSTLCERAGVPHLKRTVGSFLGEIAEWCADNQYPPLNSLAVNQETGQPGEGYDRAGGFLIINWPTDVEECVRFQRFPSRMP